MHAAARRQGAPWFDAHERRLCVRRLPDGKVRHVRAFDGHGMAAARRKQRDRARRIGEQQGVAVKQAVPERQDAAVRQRERIALLEYKAVAAQADAARRAGRVEPQRIVLKPQPVRERHAKPRMCAKAKVHGSFPAVFDGKSGGQRIPLQAVADAKAEPKRIHAECFRALPEFQSDGIRRLLHHRKRAVRCKPVQRQAILPAPVGIGAAGQPPDIGKQHRRAATPQGRVALPQNLRSVRSPERTQLRAPFTNPYPQSSVVQLVQISVPLPSRFGSPVFFMIPLGTAAVKRRPRDNRPLRAAEMPFIMVHIHFTRRT